MAGAFDPAGGPPGPPGPPGGHLQHPQDHYSVPPSHYGGYNVQPPLGSDSGSGYAVPIPPGGFSPVTSNKEYQSHHLQHQQLHDSRVHESWNNNERVVEPSYDCY